MTYIERKALPKVVELECLDRESFKPRTFRVKVYLAEDVDKMPAADVAPVKHGKWLWDGKHHYCSNCSGTRFHDLTLGLDAAYCPYCGAKMDLED